MYLGIYVLRKTFFDIFLKSPLSEQPLRGNMVNGSKRCYNLNDSTITIFSHYLEGN